MKITNIAGMSRMWVAALSQNNYDKGDADYSMTELIGPPRLRHLAKRHDEEISEDVSERLYTAFGTAMHHILAQASADQANIIADDTRLIHVINGKRVSFKPDRCEPIPGPNPEPYNGITIPAMPYTPEEEALLKEGKTPHILSDFKYTTVYKKDGSLEWEIQLNGYAWALRKAGIHITRIRQELAFRDWSRAESFRIPDYPKTHFHSFFVKMMPDDMIERWLHNRVALFESCKDTPDDALPYCTMQERWAKPDVWKVVHLESGATVKGGSSFEQQEEAENFLRGCKDPHLKKVQFVQGASPRCENYCPVVDHCSQYRDTIKKKA